MWKAAILKIDILVNCTPLTKLCILVNEKEHLGKSQENDTHGNQEGKQPLHHIIDTIHKDCKIHVCTLEVNNHSHVQDSLCECNARPKGRVTHAPAVVRHEDRIVKHKKYDCDVGKFVHILFSPIIS